ncbi:LysR substrate-binding domain-containing protein [Rhodoplanes sp. TEM]|uniref:LysR substrate-binding domain-containing protein n=1 Tax=Rhodoplanes tepidamans TaxID=200616 RepID=A0ABT5JDR8_RHOTP|nr:MULTISPECIES: LysR substrate-binding domain-containing protein [Rhodoplanes]MDC7787767.1 LysR substrate-binding domain-containing protein [Rhodoplanes tepidamans]MDC7982670.1 LysR substrate-binding domain-containing protein [Rhodoplanes sp. TEM]MDQ0357683.1 DNA-binding transcriptional LysR family regulator [Rhodoplanes tepidamans]
MDRLGTMRAFVAVADAAGFAAAARRLGMSAPAVTRAIADLEQAVGTRLLRRTTRVVRLTEAGHRFLADCRRILAETDEAMALAAGSQAEPRGRVVVTAPAMFGRRHVAPVMLAVAERYPRLALQTVFVDRVVDLVDEGVDVAVRIAHLGDSALTAARVGAVRRVVCAAPAYLDRHGVPAAPRDLAAHEAIAFSHAAADALWAFPAGGRTMTVRPRTRMVVNSAEMAVAAAAAGLGLARVLSYQAVHEVRAGRLRIVLAAHEPPPVPVHVVHADGRRAAARVRAVVDLAVERLRADAPSWIEV